MWYYVSKGVDGMEKLEIAVEFERSVKGFHLPRCGELPELDFYMDQVISIMEKHLYLLSIDRSSKIITPAMINNYVKLGLIPPPKKKRYSKEHICYLFIICTLKSVIPIPAISQIIKTQTANRSVFELYDIFCEAYENMLKEAVDTSREIIQEEPEQVEDALAKLSLFMAINAGTTQLLAASAIKVFADEESAEEADKEKNSKK